MRRYQICSFVSFNLFYFVLPGYSTIDNNIGGGGGGGGWGSGMDDYQSNRFADLDSGYKIGISLSDSEDDSNDDSDKDEKENTEAEDAESDLQKQSSIDNGNSAETGIFNGYSRFIYIQFFNVLIF